jgi:molecular chaperone GrpE
MSDPRPGETDRPDGAPDGAPRGGEAPPEPEAVPVPADGTPGSTGDRNPGSNPVGGNPGSGDSGSGSSGDGGQAGRPSDGGGDADDPAGGEVSVETLVADLERVTSERDQFREAYQRSAADFDNFRKQAQRRLDDSVARSLGGFVERLLPVLDACDAALAHGATEVEPVLNTLYQALEKEGLARVAPLGEPFDPAVAEAVVHEPGDGGEHVVSEVLRTGYTWNGRVLRPAMVKVTD